MTELRAQRNLAGHRLAPWLSRIAVAEQETARPLLTAGEILQLPPDQEIVLVSGIPPIQARKLQSFKDDNFTARCLPPPRLAPGGASDLTPARREDWTGSTRSVDYRLQLPWSDQVAAGGRRRDDEDRDRGQSFNPADFDDVATLDERPDASGRPSQDRLPDRDPDDDISDL